MMSIIRVTLTAQLELQLKKTQDLHQIDSTGTEALEKKSFSTSLHMTMPLSYLPPQMSCMMRNHKYRNPLHNTANYQQEKNNSVLTWIIDIYLIH